MTVRLVHTSDWHVGVTLGAVDRRPDLEVATDALVELVTDVRPDLVLHSGDLFDRSLPAGDDVRFAADVLARLAAVAPVLVLCGNHDGRATFAGFDRFCSVGEGRLRLLPQIDLRAPVLTWPTADGGRLRVVAVPYLPLAAAGFRAIAEGTLPEGSYGDRVRAVWAVAQQALLADRRLGDVDVAAAHLHVAGAFLGGSEKTVHVGDDAATDAAALPAVSYAAFGHIHRPQPLPGFTAGRYAGSIIPIDLAEAGERKGAVFVEASPSRAAKIDVVELPAGRPLVKVTSSFAELAGNLAAHAGAIVAVEITDTERIDHLAEQVRERLPPRTELLRAVQPGLRRPRAAATTVDADADASILLEQFAIAKGFDAEMARELAQLWTTASDDEQDLTGGAVDALERALAERSTPRRRSGEG